MKSGWFGPATSAAEEPGSALLLALSLEWAVERQLLRQCTETRLPSVRGWEKNHGMVWVGRDLINYPVPTPCHAQGPLLPAHGAPNPIQPGLECFQRGDTHSFSGQPMPGPHHPHGEEREEQNSCHRSWVEGGEQEARLCV